MLDYFCADINECVRDSINCGLNAACINTNGSYRCDCNIGFYRNGSDCCKLSAIIMLVLLISDLPVVCFYQCVLMVS